MKNKEEMGTNNGKSPERKLKRKLPHKIKFRRQESWRYKRVKENWRSPRGIDSKMRKKVKGWPPSPAVGYRNPKVSRALHPSGVEVIRVQKVEDLDSIDPKEQAIRISRTVGARKRIQILSRAEERKIHILNPRKEKELEETEEEEKEEE